MPNFFVEAMTIADGRVHSETRELIVNAIQEAGARATACSARLPPAPGRFSITID